MYQYICWTGNMTRVMRTRTLVPQDVTCRCRQCALKKRQAAADARPSTDSLRPSTANARPSTDSLRPAAANARLSPANAHPSPPPFLGMTMREAVRRSLITKRRAASSILQRHQQDETDGPSAAKRAATEVALAVYYGFSRRFLEYLQKSLMLIYNLF